MWIHVCPVVKKEGWYFKNCTSKSHKLKWSGGSLTYRCSLGRWEWSADAESESEWVLRSKPATLFCRRCGGPCFHFDRPVVDHSRLLAVGPPCLAVLWWRRDAVQSADSNWKLISIFFSFFWGELFKWVFLQGGSITCLWLFCLFRNGSFWHCLMIWMA